MRLNGQETINLTVKSAAWLPETLLGEQKKLKQ
jgi:hypothetical protein